MLKPIHYVPCSPALRACRRLQEHLIAWLCDEATSSAAITRANLAPRLPSQIEADWLWEFLGKTADKKPLIERAQAVASMPSAGKNSLLTWVQAVGAISAQFTPNPGLWPHTAPAIPPDAWKAFKELMEAFYEKGLRSGLPYAFDGAPVANGGLTYAQFVQAFRDAHRLNQDVGAREVCVLCGGPLGQTPEVDHWISKSTVPVLSVCADNLLPACGDCNSPTNKAKKQVHANGVFRDWFHPYLRHPNGTIRLEYDLQTFSVSAGSSNPGDAMKIVNLDNLLNLSMRWTREFKAEYIKQQDTLRRRQHEHRPPRNQDELQAYVQGVKADLSPTEPNYEVHNALLDAMLERSRLAAWRVELGL